jgi:hypothetical protein
MTVFTSTEKWDPERIGALALYCSDGRWGKAFDEFCQRHLLIPRYDRWALPGGPACLLPRDQGQESLQTIHGQLDFLIRVHELERIVLITHYGCAYYTGLLKCDPDGCLAAQMDEATAAAQTLRGRHSGIIVEAYLAMRRGDCLSFHRLNE